MIPLLLHLDPHKVAQLALLGLLLVDLLDVFLELGVAIGPTSAGLVFGRSVVHLFVTPPLVPVEFSLLQTSVTAEVAVKLIPV